MDLFDIQLMSLHHQMDIASLCHQPHNVNQLTHCGLVKPSHVIMDLSQHWFC